MVSSLSKRLLFAVVGLALVVLNSPAASADGCGSIQVTGLCPGSCNQEGCQEYCEAITPGPCVAQADWHSCNGPSCTCRCENDEID
jgi:hypothetical protein